MRSCVIPLDEASARIPGHPAAHAATLLERGKLIVKLSIPGEHIDNQKPHEQDEIYVVIRGRGVFFHDGQRNEFGPGDLIFVAAGTEHRFEDYSADLAVWVIFF